MHQRLKETGALAMQTMCSCSAVTANTPWDQGDQLRLLTLDGVVEGQHFHHHCFYKLAPLPLCNTHFVDIDIDMYVAADQCLSPDPPAWCARSPHSGPFGKCATILRGLKMASLSSAGWLKKLPVMTQKERRH